MSVNILNNKIVANQKDDFCYKEFLQKEIDKIEGGVTITCGEDCTFHNSHEQKIKKEKKSFAIMLYGLAFLLILFGIFFRFNVIKVENNIFEIVSFVLAYVLISYDIIVKMIIAFKEKKFFDENTLMVVASVGALVLTDFLEAIAVIVFYKIGEYFQEKAVEKSKKNISDILDLRPDTATLIIDNGVKIVSPSELCVNDIILVKPGEKIPIDGIIVKGKSSVDTKALSGEALPVDKKENDTIYSGSININNPIEIKVLKLFKDSTASKIIEFVENNNIKKAKSEKFITRFARFYTPIVVVSALILAF